MQIDDFLREYESKSDEELLRVAHDIDQLTPEARTAIYSELSRRGLKESSALVALAAECRVELPPVVKTLSIRLSSTNEYLVEVTRIYRKHFWLFLIVTVPTVVASSELILYGRNQIQQVKFEALSRTRTIDNHSLYSIYAIFFATYLASWLLTSATYGATASVLGQLKRGEQPGFIRSFVELRSKPWNFLKTSILLFAFMSFGLGLSNFLVGLLYIMAFRLMLSGLGWVLSFVLGFGAMLVVSRFALAIPAVLLDGCSVQKALFLSDELTGGKWSYLAILLSKSIIGGFVVGLLAFRVPRLIWNEIPLSGLYFMRGAFLIGLTLVEPFMFIGFSLMYVTARKSNSLQEGQTFAALSTYPRQFV